ncbi:MAG TPA: polysaccharide biosynthesis protein [Patescibacteria group bacterium]|nr:polysaccharide biosynthesis protein [Patescibacteria group bacterium]
MLAGSEKRKIQKILKGSTILVTGGTGSFGKTITKELLNYNPKEIRVYSRGEDKQFEMSYLYRKHKNLTYILGDVRDKDQLFRATEGVDYVFHAAAQKQVPASEYNTYEAVKTNIIGAQNVIDAALFHNVKKAIAISTDKAVEPVNAMGMTKALQEKLFIQANLHRNGKKTAFSCIRYGNVLGSTGSVLPHFLKQLSFNEDLSITHSEMTRFLITLDQAVQLVLVGLAESVGGEIFIPDIPSHTITDMAEVLIDMFQKGHRKTFISGVRVGEKIHETLISQTDLLRTIRKNGYYIILPEIQLKEIKKKYTLPKVKKMQAYTSGTSKKLTKQQLQKVLEKSPAVLQHKKMYV